MANVYRLTAVCFLLLGSRLSWAQTSSSIDAAHIPSSSIGMISVWPKAILGLPELKLYPLEVITASGLENFGLDPVKIERVDAMIGMPGPTGPVLAVMVTMSEPVNTNGLNGKIFVSDWQEDRGLKYRELALDPRVKIVFHPLDDSRLLFGTLPFVRMVASGKNTPGPLSAIVSKIRSQQSILLTMSLKTLRPMLEGFVESARGQIPPPIAKDVSVLASNVDYIAVRTNVGTGGKLQILLAAQDAAGAEKVEASINRMLAVGSQMLLAETQQQMRGNTPSEQAMRLYFGRLAKEVTAILAPKRTNERLLIETEANTSLASIGVLTGLLLPAVQASREAARRMQSSNNLKQICLALHNYHDAYKRFPPPAIRSPDGQSLLSWRVALLPFIEQADLYEQFHLNEPWDSEHNIKLLDKMPATFRHPGSIAPPTHSIYMAVVGEEVGLHPEKEMGFKDILDGTANTIFAVEVQDQAAVPWTAPEDFRPTQDNPAGIMRFGSNSPVAHVAFFDGSIRALSSRIDTKLLWSLFTHSGGETGNLR